MNNVIPHLIELRTRVIQTGLLFLVLFLALFYFDEKLYTWIAKPLLTQLPVGSAMIATTVTAPFIVPMKLALMITLFIITPYILFQLWSFIAPGLYHQEKKSVLPYLCCSTLLFYVGIAFAYYIICPMALGFFAKCAPAGVKVMTDIEAYLNFVLTLLVSGGIAFQVPVITIALINFGITSIAYLENLRPYVIVLAFIVGMLLTPPDVVSQILLALPMWGLFEAGLLLAKYLHNKKNA